MACETNIILAQEVFYWYSTQRYGFASAPISNGGYRFLFIILNYNFYIITCQDSIRFLKNNKRRYPFGKIEYKKNSRSSKYFSKGTFATVGTWTAFFAVLCTVTLATKRKRSRLEKYLLERERSFR